MNTLDKIDEMIKERTLLNHPFYQMWSDGKLALDSLAGYSKEYFQLVRAVPDFMLPIIHKAPKHVISELKANWQEESDHISFWIKFAAALGVNETTLQNYMGLEKTRQAINDLLDLMDSYEEGACAMYAFEKEIPKISQTKLDGLEEFYGINDPQSVEYFKLHTEADVRHAASWRNILKNSDLEPEKLLSVADKSITAQHLLLDACYEQYCK